MGQRGRREEEDEEEEGVPGGNGPCDPRGWRPADGSGDELEKGKKQLRSRRGAEPGVRGFREDGGEMDGPEEGGGESPRRWKRRLQLGGVQLLSAGS